MTRSTDGPRELAPPIRFVSLSVREIWSGERRLEGETYLSPGFYVRQRISALSGSNTTLGDIADVWQPGRLTGVTASKRNGVPYFTATQVFDTQPLARRFLAARQIPDIDSLLVAPKTILVTRSGSVGDTALSGAAHEGVVVSDDLLRVVPRDPRFWGFIYIYLRTRIGRTMARASRYGSIIKHLDPHHLAGLPIPDLKDDVFVTLNARVESLARKRDESFGLVGSARALYSRSIGETGSEESTVFVTTSEALRLGRRRLDANYHNATVRELLGLLKRSARSVERLGQVTEAIFGVPRFKHIYKPRGIPYLDSEDLFKINPEITKFIPMQAKKNAAKYFVKRGWLMMASSGQIYGINGSVVLASAGHEQKIISNHVVRLLPKHGKDFPAAGYLAVALGHPTLGRPLLTRLAFGSEVPEIAPEDLRSVPIARLEPTIEASISEKMTRASILGAEADEEEDSLVELLEKMLCNAAGIDTAVFDHA